MIKANEHYLKLQIAVYTPEEGFGKCGIGYIRISGFNSFDNTKKAMARISEALK